MVSGENKKKASRYSEFRNFTLVKEKTSYDYVGIKDCLFDNFMPRIDNKSSRGYRASDDDVTSIGITSNGVCSTICTTIFWITIFPFVTYRCELWVLSHDKMDILRKFQRCVGRHCQRFPS